MHVVEYRGHQYIISDDAYVALCEFGPAIAAGEMNEDDAVLHTLKCDGKQIWQPLI